MSAPPDTAGVRTPPLKSLIFKDSGFALSKIYQCGVFRSIEGASRGTPRGGSPTLRAAPPPPPKAPQRGVIRPPEGRGRAAPLSALRAPLRPPWGTPTGFPRLRRLPLLSLFGNGRGASEARRGGSPGEGLEKNQSGGADRGRQAAGSGNVGKAGQPVGRGGGSRWATPRVVHGVSLPLSTGREAPAGRAAISTFPLPGGPTRPPLGACSAPQGSRLPFRKSSEYTCLSSGPPEARF